MSEVTRYSLRVTGHTSLIKERRDSYAASGAGQKHIWVCPSLNIVVSQSPGLWTSQEDDVNTELLSLIADAC